LKDAYIFWKEDGNDKLLRKYLLPMEFALSHLPFIQIRDSAVDAICHGADLAATGVVMLNTGIVKGNLILLKTLKGEAVALAKSNESSDRIAKAKSGIVASSERVLMVRGRYPQMWKKHTEAVE
jgi:H/ACA ribonucleoprotein complex subunit 4